MRRDVPRCVRMRYQDVQRMCKDVQGCVRSVLINGAVNMNSVRAGGLSVLPPKGRVLCSEATVPVCFGRICDFLGSLVCVCDG